VLTARKETTTKIVKISKNHDATPIHAKCIDSRRVGSAGVRREGTVTAKFGALQGVNSLVLRSKG